MATKLQKVERRQKLAKLRSSDQAKQAATVVVGTATGAGLGMIKGAWPERAKVFGFELPVLVFAGSLAAAYKMKKYRATLINVASGAGAIAAYGYGVELGKEIADEFD